MMEPLQRDLQEAVSMGYTDYVKYLLAQGVSPNFYSGSPYLDPEIPDFPPLQEIINSGNIETVNLVLSSGASIDSPLQTAASSGYVAIVKLMLSAGASIDSPYEYLTTPLHTAAKREDAVLLDILLGAGQSLNLEAFDGFDNTPLMCAVDNSQMGNVVKLLAVGANVNSQSERDYSSNAMEIACERCDLDMVKLLLKYGAVMGTLSLEIVRARQGKNAEIIREYLMARYPDRIRYLVPAKPKNKR